jgi:uncharacterized membrane protein YbhN (UPF0104 family)
VRLGGAAAILGFLVWRLGTGPFLDGLRTVDARSLVAALVITAATTVCCAWRWRVVARGLGVGLSLPAAIAAYYRSQFLNTVLPGGVLGDVHRGVTHGRDAGQVGPALRAVAWERSAGQAVQVVLTLLVLLLLPSPVRDDVPTVAVVALACALGAVLLGRLVPHDGPSLVARVRRIVSADLRQVLLSRPAWPGVVLTSAAVVAGHAAAFLIAARTAGVSASPLEMLPLALLVLLAMGLPINIAGWGPREGAAAWVFGAAGLTAAQGVATSVVYGVMTLVAVLPGGVVLLVEWLRRTPESATLELPTSAVLEKATHG